MADDVPQFRSFEEFWPYYAGEHSNKTNRVLHFVGTSAAMTCVAAAAFLGKRRMLLLAPLCGYGAAWVGHFFIEKNRPATFTYPLWSLRGDFRMWWKMAHGEMDAEIERLAKVKAAAEAETPSNAPTGDVLN